MAMTKEEQKAAGKKARRLGGAFERKVRKDMESKGWIVDKFTNNIDLDTQKIVKAKTPFSGGFAQNTSNGFPDFVMFRFTPEYPGATYELIFIECKLHGRITKKEKLKLEFLRSRGHECFVAEENELTKEIIYKEFEKYEDKTRQMAKRSP